MVRKSNALHVLQKKRGYTTISNLTIRWGVMTNTLVHVFMYYYYFVATMGVHPWWKVSKKKGGGGKGRMKDAMQLTTYYPEIHHIRPNCAVCGGPPLCVRSLL